MRNSRSERTSTQSCSAEVFGGGVRERGAVGRLGVRVGAVDGKRARCFLFGHRARPRRQEELVLVARVAGDQLDVAARAVGQGLPGGGGQYVAVHDRAEQAGVVGQLAPSAGARSFGSTVERSVAVGRRPRSAAMTAETSAADSGERKGAPTLWAMALWNRPAAEGMAGARREVQQGARYELHAAQAVRRREHQRSAAVEPAPADSPKTVT